MISAHTRLSLQAKMFALLKADAAEHDWQLDHKGNDWIITGNTRAFVMGLKDYNQSCLMAYAFLRRHARDIQTEIVEDIFHITAQSPIYYENKTFLYLNDRSLLPLFGFKERDLTG